MTSPDEVNARVAELDAELRALENDGKRSSDRSTELSAERETLLNRRDDA